MLFEEVIKIPPARKFRKEDIVDVAYEIVKNEGYESINARRIASELGCSVQPIFHNFSSMEELSKEVYNKIYNKFKEYMLNGKNSQDMAYKQMGLAYIKFAKEYPKFFRILFMQKTDLSAEKILLNDDVGVDVIKTGQLLTGLSYEEQTKFHVKVWIFTHGIACFVATNAVQFTDKEIEELLESTVREMLKGYIGGK